MFVNAIKNLDPSDTESDTETESDDKKQVKYRNDILVQTWRWDIQFFFQKRREECERKARRGEMDPRLEFAFQLLIDATGLPRHEVMDHVFEGDMVRTSL